MVLVLMLKRPYRTRHSNGEGKIGGGVQLIGICQVKSDRDFHGGDSLADKRRGDRWDHFAHGQLLLFGIHTPGCPGNGPESLRVGHN